MGENYNQEDKKRKKRAILWWFFAIVAVLILVSASFRDGFLSLFSGQKNQPSEQSQKSPISSEDVSLKDNLKEKSESSKEENSSEKSEDSALSQSSNAEIEVCTEATARQNPARNQQIATKAPSKQGAVFNAPKSEDKSGENSNDSSTENKDTSNADNSSSKKEDNSDAQNQDQTPPIDNGDSEKKDNNQNRPQDNDNKQDEDQNQTPPQDNGRDDQDKTPPDNNSSGNSDAQNPPQDNPPETPEPPKVKITDEMVDRLYAQLKDIDVVVNTLKETDFSNIRISNTDILNLFSKKMSEFRKNSPGATIDRSVTDRIRAEAEKELRTGAPTAQLNNEYSRTAARQKADLKAQIKKSLENSARDLQPEDPAIEQIIAKIEANKEAFLRGALYLDRFYNFKIGETNLADALKNSPEKFKAGENSTDWLINLGKSLTFDKMKTENNARTFSSEISKLVGEQNLTNFLESQLRAAGITDVNSWFKETSPAQIVEGESPTGEKSHLYARLKNDNTKMILPLLKANEDLYVVSSHSSITFGSKKAYDNDFENILTQTAKNQTALNKIFYNLTSDALKPTLKRNVLVTDSLLEAGKFGQANWPEKYNSGRAEIEEFLTPMGLYRAWLNSAAEASGNGSNAAITFWMSRALSEFGQSTFVHEMVHNLDKDVLFSGKEYRTGADAEFYARGLFEPPSTDTGLNNFGINLIHDWTGKSGRLHNANPDSVNTDVKMKKYMSGVFESLYTLDYAEARAILNKPEADQKLWLKRVKSVVVTEEIVKAGGKNRDKSEIGSISDVFENISDADWQNLNLRTVEDLIDNGIVAERFIYKGKEKEGEASRKLQYYTVPLLQPIYGAVNNPSGISGPVTFRRNAFEMLALKGYKDGILPYITNQLENGTPKSDDQIVSAIFGKNTTFAEIRKEHFRKIIAQTGNLKTIEFTIDGQNFRAENFEQIQTLMNSALEKDLADIRAGKSVPFGQLNNVDKLKKAIFEKLLETSNDFQDSIYK